MVAEGILDHSAIPYRNRKRGNDDQATTATEHLNLRHDVVDEIVHVQSWDLDIRVEYQFRPRSVREFESGHFTIAPGWF